MLELKHKPSSANIIFVGTHLKAKKPYANIRRLQTKAILQYLNDKEPLFTTWKFREHDGIEEEQCRTIDYIFYKPEGFVPIAILNLPSKEDIGRNGLPSNEYPSDHLAVETIFKITR
jgi:hypothetical protein